MYSDKFLLSLRTFRIEWTYISQDDMYYINYKESNDSIQEVRNLKTMLEYANEKLSNKYLVFRWLIQCTRFYYLVLEVMINHLVK